MTRETESSADADADGVGVLYHTRGAELARPGRASSIFRAGPGVIELARLVGLTQGRSSWLEKSSWPAVGRAGSTGRASSTPIELARSDRAGARIELARSIELARGRCFELARKIELARRWSSWLDPSSQFGVSSVDSVRVEPACGGRAGYDGLGRFA